MLSFGKIPFHKCVYKSYVAMVLFHDTMTFVLIGSIQQDVTKV